MKKNILKITFVAALAVVAGVTFQSVAVQSSLSPLQPGLQSYPI